MIVRGGKTAAGPEAGLVGPRSFCITTTSLPCIPEVFR
jgi:hypothetical protein